MDACFSEMTSTWNNKVGVVRTNVLKQPGKIYTNQTFIGKSLGTWNLNLKFFQVAFATPFQRNGWS